MPSKPKLSAWELVTLVGGLSRTLFATFRASIFGIFRGRSGAVTYWRHVMYTMIREVCGNLSIRQSQASSPNTEEAYQAFAKTQRFKPDVVTLRDGTACCWLGDKTADTVILWFHGGGYALSANQGHFILLSKALSKCKSEGAKVAALVPQYDTTPNARYPHQLRQAVLILEYLTKDLGKSYSQIILGGDSAGGNLALALVSHLLHPHPEINALNDAQKVLKGVCLVSPWVQFAHTARSMKENAYKDILDTRALKTWGDAFIGDAASDNYNEPLLAPSSWWTNFPTEQVVVLAGGDELFLDDDVEFAQKLREHNPSKVEVVVSPDECHECVIVEGTFGLEYGKQANSIIDWIATQVQKVNTVSGKL